MLRRTSRVSRSTDRPHRSSASRQQGAVDVASTLAQARTAGAEIAFIVRCGVQSLPEGMKGRDLRWAQARFGLGDARTSLKDLALAHQFTNERARQVELQIVSGAVQRMQPAKFPHLDQLFRALERYTGLSVALAEVELAPLLGPVSLEGAWRMYQLLQGVRRPRRFALVRHGAVAGIRTVGSAKSARHLSCLAKEAARLVHIHGVVQRTHLRRRLSSIDPSVTNTAFERLLACVPNVSWLDEERRWLTLNTWSWLTTKSVAILAVAGNRMRIEELLDGLLHAAQRLGKQLFEATPDDVAGNIFRAFLAQQTEFLLLGQHEVSLVETPSLDALLTRAEFVLLEVLEAGGGTARRAELIRNVVSQAGLTREGAVSLLRTAGFLRTDANGNWTVRGRR